MKKAVLANFIELEEISKRYLKDSPILFSHIKKTLSTELGALNHRKLLTLHLQEDGQERKSLEPKPTKEYAISLLSFIANKKKNGRRIESFLTPMVAKVIEEEFIAFYSDVGRVGEMLRIIERQLSEIGNEYNVHRKFYNQLNMEKVMDLRTQNVRMSEMTQFVLGRLSSAEMLSTFKQVTAILGKASYKAVILNLGKTIFSSGIASFVKPVVLGVLGKIGLAAIAKTAVAKVLALIIGVGSVAVSVPAVYILIPIVFAFLSYEIYKLPKKLSLKLPEEISRKLETDFMEINEDIVEEMVGRILLELERNLVKEL